jgi:hypothetical protein
MSSKSFITETIPLDIENLHQLMPKPPKANVDEWIDWKIKTDSYNNKVWKQINGTALDLVNETHYELIEISSQLNELLKDKKLFLKINRRTEFAIKVRKYYFYSLTIVSTLQTFELEFPPFIQKLSHMSGEAIIQWIKSILPKFQLIYKEIMDLHKGFEEWPIKYMDETEEILNYVEKYKSESAFAINTAIKLYKKVYNYIKYYGEYCPELYTKLVIQKRYLSYIHNITISLAKGKIYEINHKIRPEYESDFWFHVLILVFFILIILWIIDFIINCLNIYF